MIHVLSGQGSQEGSPSFKTAGGFAGCFQVLGVSSLQQGTVKMVLLSGSEPMTCISPLL